MVSSFQAKGVHRSLLVFFLIMSLVISSFSLTSGNASATTTLGDKLDSSFYTELVNETQLYYYDVIVVFRTKEAVALLDQFDRTVKTFKHLPMARILLNKEEIFQLTEANEVLFIEPNRTQKLYNAEGRALTNAEQVQQDLGYDGSGIEVAIIDTGADGLHPDLENMLHNWQVVGDLLGDNGYVSLTPDGIDVQTDVIDIEQELGVPYNTDEYGHGTHVFGTIAGTGAASEGYYRGMAPAASVHSYSTSAGLFLIYTLEAYDHIMEQVQSGVANIRLISNSWGSEGCEFNPFNATNVASKAAYDMGILSVFAYGNSGPSPDTCNPYAAAPYVLGIAATDKAYNITGFSSRGKVDGNYDRELALENLNEFLAASPEEQANWDTASRPLGLYRPSVSAPGQDIVSAQNPLHPMTTSGTQYGSASGTSMATPHVTGILALVVQANPNLTPIDLIRLTEVTANKDAMYGYDTPDTGAGFVDALAAVQRAEANDIPSQVTDQDLVKFEPPALRTESGTYSGTVQTDSFETNVGYGLHEVEVKEGAYKIYADVNWASELEKVYISLYAPGLDVENDEPTAQSAGLLDVTNSRFVEFNFPEPGTWKIRIDGRVNVATSYNGKWEVQYPENSAPTGDLQVSAEKVKNNDPISIQASITDLDGIDDLTTVSLVVRAGNGRILDSWDKDDFSSIDDNTLSLNVDEVVLRGKEPWTVELRAEDSKGNLFYDQAFIGKK